MSYLIHYLNCLTNFKEHLILENKAKQRIKRVLNEAIQKALEEYNSMTFFNASQLLVDDNFLVYLEGEFYKVYKQIFDKCYKIATKQVKDMIDIQERQRKISQVTSSPLIANKSEENDPTFITPSAKITRKSRLRKPNTDAQRYMETENINLARKTSQKTLQDIRNIIIRGEQKGKNARITGQQIRKKLNNYKEYEAERIARTEITHSLNYTKYDRMMNDDLVEFFQWYAAHDSRTRASHLAQDMEIIYKGETFSNGQKYPGDKSVPVNEFVNCRCSLAPYIPEYNKVPPLGRMHFQESEMITISNQKDYKQIRSNQLLNNSNSMSSVLENKRQDLLDMGLTNKSINHIKQFHQDTINEPIEHMVIYDYVEGRKIKSRTGEHNIVYIDLNYIKSTKHPMVSHNHPKGDPPEPSKIDIIRLLDGNMGDIGTIHSQKEIWVINRINFDEKNRDNLLMELTKAIKKHEAKIEEMTNNRFNRIIDKIMEKEEEIWEKPNKLKVHLQEVRTKIYKNLKAEVDYELSEEIRKVLTENGLDVVYIRRI